MDTWNREELYRDIWQEPMLKLSKKYGVSNVMLGKVCRKRFEARSEFHSVVCRLEIAFFEDDLILTIEALGELHYPGWRQVGPPQPASVIWPG